MHAPAMNRIPIVTGWLAFYLLILGSWTALVLMSAEPTLSSLDGQPQLLGARAFLARCLASVASLDFLHLVVMWGLMSLGMMLPTALPVMQRLAELLRNVDRAQQTFICFLAAYLGIWLGFSMLAATLQWLLARVDLIDDAGRLHSGLLVAALFGFAGVYQFTRLKHACLTRCRHPMTFFMTFWKPGAKGAVAMGLRHGLDCLGCCWPLMLLAFVGGTMNLAWMGLAMGLMLVEKLAGAGRYVTAPLGVLLILAAGFALGGALQTM